MADPLKMKIVVGNYGHTEPVTSGRVPIEGVQPEFIKIEPLIAAFRRMVRDVEFDVCEVACTTYIVSRAYGRPFKALPLFLMRNFHHARHRLPRRRRHQGAEGPRGQESRRARLHGNDRRLDARHPRRRIRPRRVEGDLGGR